MVGAAAFGGVPGRAVRTTGRRSLRLAGPVQHDDARRAERDRLHRLIEQLVKWESRTDETILGQARWEIARSFAWARGKEPPPVEAGAAALAASVDDNDRDATSLGDRRDKWPEALAERGATLTEVFHFRDTAASGSLSSVQ